MLISDIHLKSATQSSASFVGSSGQAQQKLIVPRDAFGMALLLTKKTPSAKSSAPATMAADSNSFFFPKAHLTEFLNPFLHSFLRCHFLQFSNYRDEIVFQYFG